jgi:hypothetical protein
MTPIEPVSGWRIQHEQDPAKGLTVYFTPVKGISDPHVLPIAVQWNPKTKRYQSMDRSYQQFLLESPALLECEDAIAVSAAAPTQAKVPPAPPQKDLSGLMPYLRRYTGGIVLGLLTGAADGDYRDRHSAGYRGDDRHAGGQSGSL